MTRSMRNSILDFGRMILGIAVWLATTMALLALAALVGVPGDGLAALTLPATIGAGIIWVVIFRIRNPGEYDGDDW
jgi:hypothetical protein